VAGILIFPDEGACEEDALVAVEDDALDLSFLFLDVEVLLVLVRERLPVVAVFSAVVLEADLFRFLR
jgi:hypothetical protein